MGSDTMPAAQAVEALVHNYGKLVFRVIYGLTGDYQESQDLTQDTFLQALRAIEVARQASGAYFHAKAWLLQIAVNMVRMHRRRRNLVRFVPFSSLHEERQGESEGELVGERPAPVQPAGYGMEGTAGDPAEIVAERDAIRHTLAQLPAPFRLCLMLSVVGGLSTREIARLLGINETAVRQRLVRARKLFQHLYLRQGGETMIDGSSLKALTEARNRRLTGATRAAPVIAAVS
jgi:RNA polymerase sigma-70 factor (ECF subfamily)